MNNNSDLWDGEGTTNLSVFGSDRYSMKSVATVTVEPTLRTEEGLVVYWAQITHVASAAGSWRHHQGGKGSPGCPALFSAILIL